MSSVIDLSLPRAHTPSVTGLIPSTSEKSIIMAQMVKNLPAVWETQVESPGQKDPWRGEWLPPAVFLPAEFYGQRSLAGLQSMGSHKIGHVRLSA